LDAYLEGLGRKDTTLRQACLKAIGRIRDEALPRIEARADRLSPLVVAQLRRVYEGHATAPRGRLFAVAAEGLSPESYMDFALRQPGDPARGRAQFLDLAGLGCVKCHKVGGEGGDVGPDLSTAGT